LDPYEPEEKVVAEWIDQNTAGNVPVNRCTELDLPSHIGIILRKTIKSQLFEQDYYGACQTMSHQGNRRFFTVIDDEDATAMLINGLRISSYRLSSGYYPLKGAKIPGFIGEVTLTARLPSALMELAKPLLYFSRYGGTGIKYALGMGGVDVWG
jgi:hypothetical protein